jgi:cation:H+ antiporter
MLTCAKNNFRAKISPMIIPLITFVAAGALTWIAGVTLTKTTDSLDFRFKIGEGMGGLIILGIVGSLPEIAIAVSAAIHGHISVIIGNLIGGISVQTLVIVLLDFAVDGKRPLSYLAGSISMFFETAFAVVMVLLAIAATYIPAQNSIFHLNPLSIPIAIAWFAGLYLVDKSYQVRRFTQVAADASPGRVHSKRKKTKGDSFYTGRKSSYVIFVFILASVVILAAGYYLEESSVALAGIFNIKTGLFAATALALVTSLPEISTGLEAVFIGDNHLAISDIWGGNAFMLVPIFALDLIMGKPVLSFAQNSDRLLAGLGAVMMAIYGVAFLVRLRRSYWRLGLDSILEIILYAVGIVVLTNFV